MDWVKLLTDYYRDRTIALGDDAAEVMFTRAIALAGEREALDGFIHESELKDLSRRPTQAKRTAAYLCNPKHGEPVWEKVLGGYQIINFERIQDEAVKLMKRKRQDRRRKAAERRAARQSGDASTDTASDSPGTRPGDRLYESEREELDAAAAAGGGSNDVDVAVDILASKLRRFAALAGIRTDKLKPEQATAMLDLIEVHGDQRLVDHAVRTMRADSPPQTIQAFLAGWSALPRPGDRLAVVRDQPCPSPGHSGTTKHCIQCASERAAGEAR